MEANLLLLAQVQAGGYVSIWKTILVLLVLLVWGRLLTWADKDAPAAHLPRIPLNVGMMAGLILAFALFFYLPGFLIAFPVLVAIMLVEMGVYLGMRNSKVGLSDLGEQFNDWLRSFKGKKGDKVIANHVVVVTKAGSPLATPPEEDPQRPAYVAIQDGLLEPMQKESDHIELAPGEGGVAVRYWVDGVSYRGRTLDKQVGGDAITMLKGAAGLDTENRRKPQRANLRLTFEGKKKEFRLDTAGTTAGEYASLLLDPKKRYDFKVQTLGFTDRQSEQVMNTVRGKAGIVLVAAPKSQGQTSLLYGLLGAHDAFLEHIHTIEREPDIDLTGITQNKLAANVTPAEELKVTDWVISQEPDIIMIDRIEEPRTAQALVNYVRQGRMAYVAMRATSVAEAITQWRRLVGDDRAAVEQLSMVIAGRVVRKLCMACKVGYQPDPNTLRKLNMDPAAVSTLFQARTQPLRDPKGNPVVCAFCNDLRFKGRTGVFETLAVDDDVRQALISSGGSESQLRSVFRKQKGRFLQEEALALVEKGDTSVQEVLRVLKGGPGSTEGQPGGGGGSSSGTDGGGGGGPPPAKTPRPPSSAPRAASAKQPAARRGARRTGACTVGAYNPIAC